MKNKIKYIVAFIMGGIVFSTICVIGSNVITANQVGINSSKTTKTNIQDAIDELYDKSNKIRIKEITINNKKKNLIISSQNDTYVGIVYFDPTNLNKKCDFLSNGNTTETSGCMKWYVYDKSETNYGLLLDHNLTKENYEDTKKSLQNLKNIWGSTLGENNIGMISGNDIARITGHIDSWNVYDINTGYYFGSNAEMARKYHWLFDYTNGCSFFNCQMGTSSDGPSGYWTSDYICEDITNCDGAWFVSSNSNIRNLHIGYNDQGLRPVITILK